MCVDVLHSHIHCAITTRHVVEGVIRSVPTRQPGTHLLPSSCLFLCAAPHLLAEKLLKLKAGYSAWLSECYHFSYFIDVLCKKNQRWVNILGLYLFITVCETINREELWFFAFLSLWVEVKLKLLVPVSLPSSVVWGPLLPGWKRWVTSHIISGNALWPEPLQEMQYLLLAGSYPDRLKHSVPRGCSG